jgi:hypothetical protein
MTNVGVLFMVGSAAEAARLIGLAEQAGIKVAGGSPTPVPGNPPGPPPAPPAALPAAPAFVPPTAAPAPPTPVPAAPVPAPPAAVAASPSSDQQRMVNAMGAYIKQHGPEMAMRAFALYQVPQNLSTATPQQFQTMLQVFESLQPMPAA